MEVSLLATKLFVPPERANAVERSELSLRLSDGLLREDGFGRKLTLVSAPPGFGKTSMVRQWLAALPVNIAWLSLDEKDGDPARFLYCLVSALRTVEPGLGAWMLAALQAAQPPSMISLLTRLCNDLTNGSKRIVLVLDDYHTIGSPPIDEILAFLVDNLAPRGHITLVTREDPGLPLARYRARGQLSELRAKDLRFSRGEIGLFFRRVTGIPLSESELSALEARTEGWAAGLQFAALALQGSAEGPERAEFMASLRGSHRWILDYLVEEVLLHRSAEDMSFLLATSFLGRFCGVLCDAVLEHPSGTSQEILESLERANLFLVPLDGERCWYRYHHLFAELLQRRAADSERSTCLEPKLIHSRASLWYEENGYIVEAFRHAAASGDVVRAEALIEDYRMPTFSRGTMMEVIGWIDGLGDYVKDEHPSLWVRSATSNLVSGRTVGVEELLQKAERALRGREEGERFLLGRISMARATLATSHYRFEEARLHARRALELLPAELSYPRLASIYALGIAEMFIGDRAEARRSLTEVLGLSRSIGAVFFQIVAANALGAMQVDDNQLPLAEETFRSVIDISGDNPQPSTSDAYLGLARIHYEWNALEEAGRYAERGLAIAGQFDGSIDRTMLCDILLAKIDTAKGNLASAKARLDQAEHVALSKRFLPRIPEIREAQVLLQLKKGCIPEASGLPLNLRIRILLAGRHGEEAARLLDSLSDVTAERESEKLRYLVLRALVCQAKGDHEAALLATEEAVRQARPGGLLRLFVDEGEAMRELIQELHGQGASSEYINHILAAFSRTCEEPAMPREGRGILSSREREVLELLAEGSTNQAIAEKLFISPETAKVHVRNILTKLEAANRTQAVAKARALGLLD